MKAFAAAALVAAGASSAGGSGSPGLLVPEYYVRVLYNGKPLRLPLRRGNNGSSGSSNGETAEVVPLGLFRALLAPLVPLDFVAECGVPHGGLPTGAVAFQAPLRPSSESDQPPAAKPARSAAPAPLLDDVGFDSLVPNAPSPWK
jgi:hypothetical protein